MSITLYFVRHGQTFLNKYNRIQGNCDSPLTQQGIAAAKRAGSRLSRIHFTQAYTSDTMRTINTGKLILQENQEVSPKLQLKPMQALRELNYGYFEGNDENQLWHELGGEEGVDSFEQMILKHSIEEAEDRVASADPYQDAETSAEFWERFSSGIQEIISQAADHDQILVATHGTAIRNLVAHWSNLPVYVPTINGSITKVTWNGSQFLVDYFNNVSQPV